LGVGPLFFSSCRKKRGLRTTVLEEKKRGGGRGTSLYRNYWMRGEAGGIPAPKTDRGGRGGGGGVLGFWGGCVGLCWVV